LPETRRLSLEEIDRAFSEGVDESNVRFEIEARRKIEEQLGVDLLVRELVDGDDHAVT
jgi:hypothetical protein